MFNSLNNSDKKRTLNYIKQLITNFCVTNKQEIDYLMSLKNIDLPNPDNGYQITTLPADLGMSKLNFVLGVINANASDVYLDETYANDLKDFLYSDSNSIVGVHLPGAAGNLRQDLIFNNGLENTGDLLRGMAVDLDYVDINKTVTLVKNFADFVMYLKTAVKLRYKMGMEMNNPNQNGAYIVKIPKTNLGLDDHHLPQPIYYLNDRNMPTLLPEYVVGFLEFNGNRIGHFNINPNYGRKTNVLATVYEGKVNLKNQAGLTH